MVFERKYHLRLASIERLLHVFSLISETSVCISYDLDKNEKEMEKKRDCPNQLSGYLRHDERTL